MKKLIIITNSPSPYRIDLFNKLCVQLEKYEWTLKIFFLVKQYERRKWAVTEQEFRFEYLFLGDFFVTFGEGLTSVGLSIPLLIRKESPDSVIIANYSIPSLWAALSCKMAEIPYHVWSGETLIEYSFRNTFLGLRTAYRRWLLRNAQSAIAYGQRAVEYLIENGMSVDNVHVAINTVDTGSIERRTLKMRPRRAELIHKYGLPKNNILFVGYLESRKGAHLILEAVQALKHDIGVHIVGSGKQEASLKTLATQLGLKHIYFWGYKQKDELTEFYVFCDMLVFPSTRELYGLVPIEAMAAGLPIICSELCGCASDLIVDNHNGLLVDPRNITKLSEKIRMLLHNDIWRGQIGENGQTTVKRNFQLDHTVQGFLETLKLSC